MANFALRMSLSLWLVLSCFAAAQAQGVYIMGKYFPTLQASSSATPLPPTDYGAGYKIVMFSQHQEHTPGAGDDPDEQGPVTLDIAYPLIAGPLTPEAKAYNTAITQLAHRWWKDIGAPADNSQAADPNITYSLGCMPVGVSGNDGDAPDEQMLPDVISMSCAAYVYFLGAAHGRGSYSGFNWLVRQHRPILASDIFIKNSGWLKALAAMANAGRQAQQPAPWIKTLDFADSRHWVLGTEGLGLAYSTAEFSGFEAGGDGGVEDLIPWSKLAPYLRKDGIVPQKYWHVTPNGN